MMNEGIVLIHGDASCGLRLKLCNLFENCMDKTPCIWLGYGNSHTIGTYHVLNPKTKQVMLTQEAVFIKSLIFMRGKTIKKKKRLQ